MTSLSAIVLFLAASANALALSARPAALRVASPRVATQPTMLFGLFGDKKTPEEILEEKGYWPGEWVCADCGYLYEPGTIPPFEELKSRWKCPQCAGPRRRFVKRAGDQYSELDDSPLYIGMGASVAFIIFALYVALTA